MGSLSEHSPQMKNDEDTSVPPRYGPQQPSRFCVLDLRNAKAILSLQSPLSLFTA